MRAGLEQLLRERSGQPAQFTTYVAPDAKLTPQLLGPDSAWTPLAPKEPRGTGFGSIVADDEGFVLSGPKDSGDWADFVLSGDATFRDAWVRCRAEPVDGCFGVKLALGLRCQALLIGSGAFIYTDVGGVAFQGNQKWADRAVDIVMRREAGWATVWFDGVKVLEAQIAGDAAPVSIGVVQGRARFTQVAVRVPKG